MDPRARMFFPRMPTPPTAFVAQALDDPDHSSKHPEPDLLQQMITTLKKENEEDAQRVPVTEFLASLKLDSESDEDEENSRGNERFPYLVVWTALICEQSSLYDLLLNTLTSISKEDPGVASKQTQTTTTATHDKDTQTLPATSLNKVSQTFTSVCHDQVTRTLATSRDSKATQTFDVSRWLYALEAAETEAETEPVTVSAGTMTKETSISESTAQSGQADNIEVMLALARAQGYQAGFAQGLADGKSLAFKEPKPKVEPVSNPEVKEEVPPEVKEAKPVKAVNKANDPFKNLFEEVRKQVGPGK